MAKQQLSGRRDLPGGLSIRPFRDTVADKAFVKQLIKDNRDLFVTGGFLLVALAILVIPWRTSIAVSAVLQATARAQIYAPLPSQVQAVHVQRGDDVAKGDVLLTLDSPGLDHQIAQGQRRVAMARLQVRREAAGGREAENIRILRSRLAGEITTLHGLEERQALLTVRAPIDGRVTDLNPVLMKGLWVNDTGPLARVVALDAARLDGFVDERELSRIPENAVATFYPDDPGEAPIAARVVSLAAVNSRVLDVPYLATVHGGDVAVEKDRRGNLVATRGIYRVTLAPETAQPAPAMVRRGIVHIQGAPESLIMRAWNRTWGVVLRESGF